MRRPVIAMPLLSEIPWQPARPKRRRATWAIAVAAGFIVVLALFSRGILPEPEARLPKPSAVTSTSKIEPRARDAPAPGAKSNEQQPVRDGNSWHPPADNAPSTYDGLRRELLEGH